MIGGIYQIYNKTTDRAYVGSSEDLKKRTYFHMHALSKNAHPNSYLQHGYNKYGKDAFEIRTLEKVQDKSVLLAREQYWMDATLSESGSLYNLNPQASSGIGHHVSTASRKVISDKLKAKKIKPPSRSGIGYGFCKLYCPAKHYKTAKMLIHGSNACKECQRLKSAAWRENH